METLPCTIGREDSDRGRDVPALMFDHAVCGLVRMSASPIAELAALAWRRSLLNDALGRERLEEPASTGVHSGASMGSREPNRREAHARTTSAAKPAARSGAASVRSLRRRPKDRCAGAGLERSARSRAPGCDDGVDAADAGSSAPKVRNARPPAALGFSDIETIDDDIARSAAGGVVRAGFERMVAQGPGLALMVGLPFSTPFWPETQALDSSFLPATGP